MGLLSSRKLFVLLASNKKKVTTGSCNTRVGGDFSLKLKSSIHLKKVARCLLGVKCRICMTEAADETQTAIWNPPSIRSFGPRYGSSWWNYMTYPSLLLLQKKKKQKKHVVPFFCDFSVAIKVLVRKTFQMDNYTHRMNGKLIRIN